MATNKVDWEEFVKVYMQVYDAGGASVDVATQLNIPVKTVRSRTDYIRRQGVALPTFKARSNQLSKLTVSKLNNLVQDKPAKAPGLKKPPVV